MTRSRTSNYKRGIIYYFVKEHKLSYIEARAWVDDNWEVIRLQMVNGVSHKDAATAMITRREFERKRANGKKA